MRKPDFVLRFALMLGLFSPDLCIAQDSAPAGFKPLFDGHSLSGWHSAPRLSVPKTAGEALSPAPASKPPGKSAQGNARGRWDVRDGVVVGGQDEQRFVHREDGADWRMGS